MNTGKGLVAAALLSLSTSALAIGTTECASGDGQLRRTEEEIWGANLVAWEYRGERLPDANIKLDAAATVVISDVSTQHPEWGKEVRRTSVEQAQIELLDGSTVSEYVLCKTVEYPELID